MIFPDYIPGDGPCVLADGVPFVPGMPVWLCRPLGEPEAIQTEGWEAGRILRWDWERNPARPWSYADTEWTFYLSSGGTVGVAALFVSQPVGRIPEFV